MKLMIILLLLAVVTHAAQTGSSRIKQKIHDTEKVEKTEKRELAEGNSGVEKRAPLLPIAAPTVATGGVEYADTKEGLQDKSPTQQIYATPVPQIAKISDVLTGQGPPFQAAIASHLYSPISVYQPRLGSPTTYHVSPPVPSQLAYTEHRLSVPSPNAIQYNSKPQKLTKQINYVQQQQQVLAQPSYEQNFVQIQPYQQVPHNSFIQNYQQPILYNQPQVYPDQQQLQYVQEQPAQPIGNIYARQQQPIQYNKQTEQRDLKSQPAPSQILEKQQIIQQDYNGKQQNALSYARLTINQGPSHEQYTTSLPIPQQESHQQLQQQQLLQAQPQQYSVPAQPIAQINYQLQHPVHQLPQLQYQAQQPKSQPLQQQQIQYQSYQEPQQPQVQYQQQQPLQYQQPKVQYQEPQPQYVFQQPHFQQQIQSLPDLQLQSQSQYQLQPQQYQLPQVQPQPYNVESETLLKQLAPQTQAFLKQAPIQQHLIQPETISQDLGYKNSPALPTFPPVQYFGKFAHSIFGNRQHS